MMSMSVKIECLEQAVKLVELMEQCMYDVDIIYGSRTVDAKSLLGVLMLVRSDNLKLVFHTEEDAARVGNKVVSIAA